MTMILHILALIILLFLSGFFSGSETACMAVSRIQAQAMVKQKKRGAETLLKLKEQPRRLIITILIGNNIVNIGASALATVIATNLFGSAGAGIATGLMTFLILIFGEISPKSYATVHSKKMARRVAPFIMVLSKVLHPLVTFFEYLTTEIIKWFGSTKKTEFFSETELRTLVEVGVQEKRLEKTEKDFIEGVLEFNDIKVKNVMTPKKRMFSLEENTTVEKAVKDIDKREHSRIPVYRKTKDNIIGFLYLKDLLAQIVQKKNRIKIKDVVRKPLFVNEDTIISEVFTMFKKRHIHMAMVVNKHHTIRGVVTMEDVLEEIVGEILDETDNKKAVIVHGDTEIDDLNMFFNIAIPSSGNMNTVNEFLETIRKKRWEESTKVRYKHITFTIKQLEENVPVTVVIEKK
jgi:putative hemolysin